jgi:hypothetical protein
LTTNIVLWWNWQTFPFDLRGEDMRIKLKVTKPEI